MSEWLSKHPVNVIGGLIATLLTIWSAVKESTPLIVIGVGGLVVAIVAPLIKRRTGKPQEVGGVNADSVTAQPVVAREERRMECRFCDGSGKIATFQNQFHANYEPCGFCGGHGDFLTALWSQPDCKFCGGTGRVVTRATVFEKDIAPCGICRGTGKRPFDT